MSREPFQTLPLNVASPSASSSSRSTPAIKPLAPIFTRTYSRPRSTTCVGSSASPLAPKLDQTDDHDARAPKRARVDPFASASMDVDENAIFPSHRRNAHSIQEWFVTTSIRGEAYSVDSKDKGKQREEPLAKGEWKRRRGRGVAGRTSIMTSYHLPQREPFDYLETFVTRLDYHPEAPPSALFVPSIHPWDGPRDFAPPLAISFSHSAKLYNAYDAKSVSQRRLIAVAAEEGGVRVIDVDEGLGANPDAQGWFWRAHGNAVLDLKWSKNDKNVLTASGDATCRLHALDGANPTLVASLTGHHSSVKSCTFFDPTGSHIDPSHSSCIASAGRDGNILIYDIRAPGNPTYPSARRSGRSSRYSQGIEGFAPQGGGEIRPVMEIRAAHDPQRKKEKSISTIIALETMPGRLASGAAQDAAVKVWDPRFNCRGSPQPLATLADPTASAKRARGIHSMVEQPSTGDLHLLTGAGRVHVVRPSAMDQLDEAVQPFEYFHEQLRSSFWMRLSFSPCGRYLAGGSMAGGVMTWDTQARGVTSSGSPLRENRATRLDLGGATYTAGRGREVTAVDWGNGMIAACSDDNATRIWRSEPEVAQRLKANRASTGSEWAGVV